MKGSCQTQKEGETGVEGAAEMGDQPHVQSKGPLQGAPPG